MQVGRSLCPQLERVNVQTWKQRRGGELTSGATPAGGGGQRKLAAGRASTRREGAELVEPNTDTPRVFLDGVLVDNVLLLYVLRVHATGTRYHGHLSSFRYSYHTPLQNGRATSLRYDLFRRESVSTSGFILEFALGV